MGADESALACPNPATCEEVGDFAGRTVNGGKSWTLQTVPVPAPYLTTLACPSAKSCFTFGSQETLIIGSGGMQTVGVWPQDIRGLYETSCGSVSWCVAIGQRIAGNRGNVGPPVAVMSADEGRTWKELTLPGRIDGLSNLSCPEMGSCLLLGQVDHRAVVLKTTDSGRRWTTLPFEHALGQIYQLACSSNSACIAVDASLHSTHVLRTTDSGRSWFEAGRSLPKYFSANAVACTTLENCVVLGQGKGSEGFAFFSHDGGRTWGQAAGAAGMFDFNGLVCFSDGACRALGDSSGGSWTTLRSSNAGASWAETNGGFVSSLDGIACPTSKSCLAVGQSVSDAGLILKSNGITANWKQTFMDPAHPSWSDISIYKDISCAGRTCVAVGQRGPHRATIATSHSDGTMWRSVVVPSGVEELDGVSCRSSRQCVAVGRLSSGHAAILMSSDAALSWHKISSPRDVVALNDVTCRDNAECIAVGRTIEGGGVVLVTSERVHRWTAEWEGRSKGEMMGVACSSLVCHAVGFMGPPLSPRNYGKSGDFGVALLSKDAGRTWIQTRPHGRAGVLAGIACQPTGQCAAVGWSTWYWDEGNGGEHDVVFRTANAGSWTQLSVPDQYDSFGIQGVTTWGAGGFAALDQNGQGVSVLAQTSSRRT
jgi:hypothetical protein